MFVALKQLFAALTILFGSIGRFANATDQIAVWCEEEAMSFNAKARLQRNQVLADLKANAASPTPSE